MALVKPLLSPIASFDATQSQTLHFIVNGGDQVVKNTIQILNNQTSAVVYEHTEHTFSYEQTIPANTLTNGTYYAVRFKTFDRNDNASAWSDLEPFYCYSTPTVSFNITNGQEVNESNLQVELSYNQAQHELLNYAVIDLYDSDHRLIETSSYIYNASTEFPIVCRYTFHGLINMNTYYIKGRVNTLNNMNVETDFVSFHIRYINPILHSGFHAEVENCHNFVKLTTNVKVVSGVYNPQTEEPHYIDDNTAIDLRSMVANIGDGLYSKYAEFSSGYVIPKNFLFRLWFKVGKINKNIAILQSADTSETMYAKWVRGSQFDYVEIKTDSGTVLTSNGVAHSNGNNEYFLWLKIVGNSWELQLEELSNTPTVMEWNNANTNIQNLATLDKTYVGESFETYSTPPQRQYALSQTITDLIIGNGVFYHMNVSTNIDMTYTHNIPSGFDEYTIMDCSFNGNLNGGSADSDITNLKALKIKRKKKTDTQWVTIYEHTVSDFSDLEIEYDDYYISCGKEIDYALVPVLNGNIDGDYYVETVEPQWTKVVLSDKDNHFEFISDITYSNFNNNIQVGLLQPIGTKYPTVMQNSKTNYLSGQINLKLLGYEYDGVAPNRIDAKNQLMDVLTFLTNGKPKVLTDWNGNAIVFRVSETPTYENIKDYGLGIYTVSFNFVEQGKIDNETDLEELNLKG